MAAHFTGQFGTGLAHLRLDQRVPGLPHDWTSARLEDKRLQLAGALDVIDDRSAGVSRQHITGKKHQQSVWINYFPGRRHDAETIAVAVERHPKISLQLFYRHDQILQVARVG